MKDSPRQQFRWAPHVSGTANAKPKDFEEQGQVEALHEYDAWRQLRDSIRDLDATVVDYQEAFPGICCVSAPVWRQNGTCAAAVTVLLADSKAPPGLADLVVHAARRIGAGLA